MGDELVEIAEHVVFESWSAALSTLLYAAVLIVAGGTGNRGRGTPFCVEANRIGRMIGAVYVRPRAHGEASPALWPVIKHAPRTETAGEILARHVETITAKLDARRRERGGKSAVIREVSQELSEALKAVVATEAPPGAEVQMKYI